MYSIFILYNSNTNAVRMLKNGKLLGILKNNTALGVYGDI